MEKGPQRKGPAYSVIGNCFYAEIGDGSNSAEGEAQRGGFEFWILVCCWFIFIELIFKKDRVVQSISTTEMQ